MKQYLVDAFTDRVFGGNPAAVCVLEHWLTDSLMQRIASENNLSETAFVVREANGDYRLRWFTPAAEIDFCGHATLATAFVIKTFVEPNCSSIRFQTMSGLFTVKAEDGRFEMDFPQYRLLPTAVTETMTEALGVKPCEAYLDRDLLMVLDSEEAVRGIKPNPALLKRLPGLCIAVTAPGTDYDCVSRVFAPELNVPEDPVTGSTHCMIAPYWANRLKKVAITAYQASERGGVLSASVTEDRVVISGSAVLFGIADILPDGAMCQ